MIHHSRLSTNGAAGRRCITTAATVALLMLLSLQCDAFTAPQGRSTVLASTTRLRALNKGGKFNKQKALAEKMAEAKRQREIAEGGGDDESPAAEKADLSAEEIKQRNDRQRFADLLENSISAGGDIEKGSYLTVQQEEENADAVCEFVLVLN